MIFSLSLVLSYKDLFFKRLDIFLIFISLAYYILIFLNGLKISLIPGSIGTIINYCIGLMCLLVFLASQKDSSEKINKKNLIVALINKYKFFITLMTILIVLDASIRIGSVFIENGFNLSKIYQSKVNSIIFTDSNSLGLMVLSLLSVNIFLYELSHDRALKFFNFVLLALIVLTISRSAIVSSLILIFLVYIKQLKILILKYRSIIYASLIFLLIGFMYFTVNYLSNFEISTSLNSRARAYSVIFDYVDRSILEVIFGVGLHNSKQLAGMYSHAQIANWLIEAGLVGFILNFLIHLRVLYLSRWTAFLIIPQAIAGFAYFNSHGFIYYFASMGLIIFLEKKFYSDAH